MGWVGGRGGVRCVGDGESGSVWTGWTFVEDCEGVHGIGEGRVVGC
jgi:hypothetical protein